MEIVFLEKEEVFRRLTCFKLQKHSRKNTFIFWLWTEESEWSLLGNELNRQFYFFFYVEY
jgi:hypothetical protein